MADKVQLNTRIDPRIYAAICERVAKRGDTITDIVNEALRRFLKVETK